MATRESKEKELLEAFARIGNVWGLTRQGIIVSFNGARVGTWTWTQSKMMIKPENDDFKSVVKKLNKEGISVAVPAPRIDVGEAELKDSDVAFYGPTIAFDTEPLANAAPGLLDHALKLEGFYLIDLNLPIGKDAE